MLSEPVNMSMHMRPPARFEGSGRLLLSLRPRAYAKAYAAYMYYIYIYIYIC